jgi:hypothetical protein
MALFSSNTTMFGRDLRPSTAITCSRRSSCTRLRTSPAAVPTRTVIDPWNTSGVAKRTPPVSARAVSSWVCRIVSASDPAAESYA